MKHDLSRLSLTIAAYAGAIAYCRTRAVVRLRVLAGLAASSTALLLTTHGIAVAADDLAGYSAKVSGKTNVVVDIVTYLCYIGGAILSALGIIDLKKHVENPSQTPMKNGLAKLGFGGILLALPFVSGVMQGTMSGEGAAEFKQWGNKPVIGGG